MSSAWVGKVQLPSPSESSALLQALAVRTAAACGRLYLVAALMFVFLILLADSGSSFSNLSGEGIRVIEGCGRKD